MDRSEAIRLGLPHYFPDDPCKRGHLSERSTKHHYCIECHRIDQRATPRGRASTARRQERNLLVQEAREAKALKKAEAAALRAARKPTRLDRQRDNLRAWRAANPGRMEALQKAWREKNRDKVRSASRARRLCKKTTIRRELMKLQRGRCAYCRVKLGDEFHVDHVMPLKRGGPDKRSNLQLTCPTCNMVKNAQHPVEFARSLGKLL